MPAKSQAQYRLMQAAAHDPKFAKKVGVPQSVGKEFADATEDPKALPEHKRRATIRKAVEAAEKK